MKLKQKLLALAGIIVAILVLVWIIAVPLSKIDSASRDTTSSPQKATPEEKAVAGKVDDQRKLLAGEAQGLIKDALASTEAYGGLDKATKAIQDGDLSDLTDDYLARIRLVDYFERDKNLQLALHTALLNMAGYVEAGGAKAGTVALLKEDGWKNVYVDMEAGQAFVPVGIFVTQGATLSLEFNYVGGKWKFAPYSFVDLVSALAATQLSNSQPPAGGS